MPVRSAASQAMLYRTVILPAILSGDALDDFAEPGRRLGCGPGRRISRRTSGLATSSSMRRQFAFLDRMFLIALLFILYTSVSYWAISRVSARMLAWAPPSQRQ